MLKQFDKTVTVESKGKKYTNNLQTCQITCDKEILENYCILAVDKDIATIKKGATITQAGVNDLSIKDIIPLFVNPPRKTAPKKTQKKENKKSKGKDQK